MATSPSDPIREWVGPNDEPWVALALLILAAQAQLVREGHTRPSMRQTAQRVNEWRDGRRTPSDETLELVSAFDEDQRANGYTGP